MAVILTPGQRHESTQVEAVLGMVQPRGCRGRPRGRPGKLASGKGFNHPHIRRWLARYGIKAVSPRRKDQRPDDGRVRFGKQSYPRRSTVEQCIGRLKECLGVVSRFDRLAVNYQATIH